MRRSPRTLGFLGLGGAILCFSLGSTIVKKAGIPGPTMAFWRMVVTTVLWFAVLRVTERRWVTRTDLRRALVPGVLFGLNIVLFFTGVTKTSVANAEFIGSLTPLLVVPIGAIVFHERINARALWFGLISLTGLMIVLFNAPSTGVASWEGNFVVVGAMLSWAAYLTASRRLRAGGTSVALIMASIMPIAAVTELPIALARGELDDVTMRSVPYILFLAVLTGAGAHGLMVYAQHTVPIGTIGILQVAQPALAVVWAYLILDQTIRPVQVVGMALVITGLAVVVTITRRTAPPPPEPAIASSAVTGELGGPPG